MEYDYIIVGGGSAGCVMANRLSARPNTQVLLIEAGIDTPPDAVPADISNTFPAAAYNPRYKWMKLLAYTQSLRRNAPVKSPLVLYDQGRVMGGGSSVNLMAANRGSPDDYDEWRDLGADGWGWDDVLPFFRKLEDDHDRDGPLHGKGGPLPIERMRREDWCGFSEAAAQSFEEAGYPFLDDQNGEFKDGYFACTLSNLPTRRVSAAVAYLDAETRRRPNLHIMSETHVKNVIFEGRRAVGVNAVTKAGDQELRANEIILSSGAVHTPAMLMRSGVGPGAALSALGIEVIADIPGIGENLRDHPGVPVVAYLPEGARLPAHKQRPLQISLRYSSGLEGCPQGDMYSAVFCKTSWHKVGDRLGMIMTWVNKSFSTGRVSLATTDWRDEPKVELNLLEDRRDCDRLLAGMRSMAAMFQRGPLQRATRDPFPFAFSKRGREANAMTTKNAIQTSILATLLDGPGPLRRRMIDKVLTEGVELHSLLADTPRLEEFVRLSTMGIKHLSCTCRMGRPDDPMAVTDFEGRVRGLDGLRVVDTSVMPSLPRANTNIPVLMVAEKIADRMTSN